MRYVTLGDVCKKASSNIAQKDLAENSGNYPIYGAAGLIKKVDFYHQSQGYIAVVKDGAGVGRTMLLPAQSSVTGTMQYLLPSKDVNINYLYYAVTHMNLARYYSGATIPHIYFKDYQGERLPLPAMAEQEKIAATLSKIDQIILKRGRQIEKMDELVKSRFVEMFGDPVSNPMGWEKYFLSDCLESIDNGKSFICDSCPRIGTEPAILKLSAVTYGMYKPNENKAIIDRNDFVESAEVHNDDLLFTRKNTPELVGMSVYVSVTPEKLMLPDLIFRLNTKKNCNKIFLWKLINHDLFRLQIQNLANGSAKSMSNISKEKLGMLVIVLPPLKLQQQFAAFVVQTDKLKLSIRQSLDKLELLKQSLMQQYFS